MATVPVLQDIDIKLLTPTGVDIPKALEKFKNGGSKMEMGKFKINEKTFKVNLVGEVTTNGLAEKQWTNNGKVTTTFTIGIKLPSDDLDIIEDIQTKVFTPTIPEDFELTSVLKNDIIYLKVKDKKNFNAMSNVKADLVVHGQEVTILTEFKFYLSFEEKKAGLVISPLKYTFETN